MATTPFSLQVSSPSDGVYLTYETGQRPVEGVAVYLYRLGTWVCESHGATSAINNCAHVIAAQNYWAINDWGVLEGRK